MFAQFLRNRPKLLESVQGIKAQSIKAFIETDADLGDQLSAQFLRSSDAKRVAGMETAVLIEVLYQVHPDLATVLDSTEGRQWWERQRQDVARRR